MDVLAKTDTYLPQAPSRKRQAQRPWLATIVAASAVCLAYLIGVFVNWGDAADRSLYANLGLIPIGLTATILAAQASRHQTNARSQWAWRLLAAGMLCFFAGDVLYFVYDDILGGTPFPSLADAGYLTYYPLVFAGLLCFPSVPLPRKQRAGVYLDCFVVMLGGAVVVLYFLLLPTLDSSHDDLFAYALSAGYPVGDLFLLGGLAWATLRRVPGRPWSILLLAGGLMVGLAADVVYGYESMQATVEAGGISDALFMVSWAFFAWAGFADMNWVHRPAGGRAGTSNAEEAGVRRMRSYRWVRLLLTYSFVYLAVGMLVYVNRSVIATRAGVVTLIVAALVVVTFARQLLGSRSTDRAARAPEQAKGGPDER